MINKVINIKNILVSGSLVYDRIMDFPGYFSDHIMPDKIHILNVSFAVNGLKESFGGTAGNIAYNLSLLGERPVIISAVGKDFGPYGKWLKKNKIDISQVKIIKENNTASAYIITDKADNQITGFNPGALAEENRSVLDSLRESKTLRLSVSTDENNYFAIIAPGNNKDMENYARFYKKAGVKYIFDPGQQITTLKAGAIKRGIAGADVLIGNDYEISLISKKTGWTLKKIIDKVGRLIITKGEKGSVIFTKKKKCAIRAVKLKKTVDPTGAGDAYRAGLIKGMVEGYDIRKAGQLASIVASYAVEKCGTQEHGFTPRDIRKRYKDTYKENF